MASNGSESTEHSKTKEFSSLTTVSKLSQLLVKGAAAKLQAFHSARTGTPNCWHIPPRRPSV